MNGRSGKILLCILCAVCGAVLLAGCTTTAPSGAVNPTPGAGGTSAGVSAADLGSITTLLTSIDQRLSTVVENTRPEGRGTETGNIVLFDNNGNTANTLTSDTSLVALPTGKCDIAIFSQTNVGLFVTVEEEKNMDKGGGPDQRYYRNRQNCINVPMCRKTVQLDDDFSYLYIEYKTYNPGNTLSRVTLSYRCK